MVECTGEGIMFVEAKANVSLEQFGHVLQPPFPGEDDLLQDVPGSAGILHSPLLLIQATRFMCGGFVIGFRLNHTMSDGAGMKQFITAIGEIARGAQVPSIQPVWSREFLNARNPPQVSCIHNAYHKLNDNNDTPIAEMAYCCYFFSLQEIASLRNNVPSHLLPCSDFDILTAALWKSRTTALDLNSDDEVCLAFAVNARSTFNPPLPVGYYGNTVVLAAPLSTASELCQSSLGYAVELIKKAKAEVKNEEFIRSAIDLLAEKGRPHGLGKSVRTYCVSNWTRMGLEDIDYGWGKAAFAGPTGSCVPGSFFFSSRNNNGEEGIVVTVNLPGPVMERFDVEIKNMIRQPNNTTSTG